MKRLLILALCGGLSACNTATDAAMSDTFGQAVASMNSQIIPVAVSDQAPESSGARGAIGVHRSDNADPKPLEAEGTSDVKVTLVPYMSK